MWLLLFAQSGWFKRPGWRHWRSMLNMGVDGPPWHPIINRPTPPNHYFWLRVYGGVTPSVLLAYEFDGCIVLISRHGSVLQCIRQNSPHTCNPITEHPQHTILTPLPHTISKSRVIHMSSIIYWKILIRNDLEQEFAKMDSRSKRDVRYLRNCMVEEVQQNRLQMYKNVSCWTVYLQVWKGG